MGNITEVLSSARFRGELAHENINVEIKNKYRFIQNKPISMIALYTLRLDSFKTRWDHIWFTKNLVTLKTTPIRQHYFTTDILNRHILVPVLILSMLNSEQRSPEPHFDFTSNDHTTSSHYHSWRRIVTRDLIDPLLDCHTRFDWSIARSMLMIVDTAQSEQK